MLHTCVLCVVLFFLHGVNISNGRTFEEDITLNAEEKEILDQFKTLVVDRLPHEYMKEDIYLVRWLRARRFNIDAAKKMLLDNVKWRNDNKLDTIFEEDWKEMEHQYPYYLEARDKEGKPLLHVNAEYWDLRYAIISGRRELFNRYIDKGLEDACGLVRELGNKYKNISQGILLVNAGGFNLYQHGCLQCVEIFLRILITYEAHYPGCADKIIVVNLPQSAEFIVTPSRSVFHPETNRALHLFGTNKKYWQKRLMEWFQSEELPPELGGTRLYKGRENLNEY